MTGDRRRIADAAFACLTTEEVRLAVREGVQDWLDGQFILIGRWAVRGFIGLVLSGLLAWALVAMSKKAGV